MPFFFDFDESKSEIVGSTNKGDWSEFYSLLYLVGQKVLYCADRDLNKLPSFFFPINRIIRSEDQNKIVQYIIGNSDQVEIWIGNSLIKTLSSEKFVEEANYLYNELIIATGRSIDIPRSRVFLNNIGLDRLGMPNTEVSDIKLDLHDTHTGINQVMGFSIKSYIGGAPTLLNASGSTNFAFEVLNINEDIAERINCIDSRNKIMDRIKAIYNLGGGLVYSHMISHIFKDNLTMIDSNMELILSEIILDSYVGNVLDCESLLERLEFKNPLKYSRGNIYTYKFKEFLMAKALGMNPDTEWDGIDNANGGYIVVKEDGEVLAYHIYNRDELKQYLLDNTRLERASTTRHGYATIYKDKDKMFINLNLQIRFKENG